MSKALKITGKILRTILVSILVLLVLYTGILAVAKLVFKKHDPALLGIGVVVVGSSSMKPAFDEHDMLFILKQKSYKVGDDITFKETNVNSSFESITHRIIEVTENGYITQGINQETNNTPDPEIPRSYVYGKVIGVLPNVGPFISFVGSPAGIILIVGALVLLLVVFWMVDKARKGNVKR